MKDDFLWLLVVTCAFLLVFSTGCTDNESSDETDDDGDGDGGDEDDGGGGSGGDGSDGTLLNLEASIGIDEEDGIVNLSFQHRGGDPIIWSDHTVTLEGMALVSDPTDVGTGIPVEQSSVGHIVYWHFESTSGHYQVGGVYTVKVVHKSSNTIVWQKSVTAKAEQIGEEEEPLIMSLGADIHVDDKDSKVNLTLEPHSGDPILWGNFSVVVNGTAMTGDPVNAVTGKIDNETSVGEYAVWTFASANFTIGVSYTVKVIHIESLSIAWQKDITAKWKDI